MIIHTGSRTDIPAYYSRWFYNRIKEGYVLVRNPYYPEQVIGYQLNPKVVDAICFCTKNPEPMLDRLHEICEFQQIWFVTITPYGKEVEPYVPDKEKVMNSLKNLSKEIGARRVHWRYDPVFIHEKYTVDFHIQCFEKMAKNLSGYVSSAVISFIDLYQKTKKNFPNVRVVTRKEQETLMEAFAKTGKKYGITIRTCCENKEFAKYGVDVSGCMTQQVMEKSLGYLLKVPKSKSVRQECNCLLGNDIGMYNTCGHGCLYCYANYDRKTVCINMKQHDPESPLLVGVPKAEEKISWSKQESYCDGQLCFDLF